MGSGANRRDSARPTVWCVRVFSVLAVMAVALGCAGCSATSSDGSGAGLMLAAAPGSTPVVAFESIDGPPKSVYGKLVHNLSEAARTHKVAVVSRNAPANYRVRIYAATTANRKRSILHWVWDVYDANQQRAFRISGEEPISNAGRATWASADDKVIRKVARVGMERLANYLHAPEAEPAPAPPAVGPAIAMAAEH